MSSGGRIDSELGFKLTQAFCAIDRFDLGWEIFCDLVRRRGDCSMGEISLMCATTERLGKTEELQKVLSLLRQSDIGPELQKTVHKVMQRSGKSMEDAFPKATVHSRDNHSKEQTVMMYLHSLQDQEASSVESLLAGYVFCASQYKWLKIFGENKRVLIEDLISKHKPRFYLEFGTYCGYSLLAAAKLMTEVLPDEQIKAVGLEISPVLACIAKSIVEDPMLLPNCKRRVLFGKARDRIPGIVEEFGGAVDLLFLDHQGSAYLRDLQFASQHRILKPGTVIVADNVLSPGVPDYLWFVRTRTDLFDTTLHWINESFTDGVGDLVTVSVYKGNEYDGFKCPRKREFPQEVQRLCRLADEACNQSRPLLSRPYNRGGGRPGEIGIRRRIDLQSGAPPRGENYWDFWRRHSEKMRAGFEAIGLG